MVSNGNGKHIILWLWWCYCSSVAEVLLNFLVRTSKTSAFMRERTVCQMDTFALIQYH